MKAAAPATTAAPTAAAPVICRDEPAQKPLRIVLHASEGWGKTTFGAHAPRPLIAMMGGEQGYLRLRNKGRVPLCSHVKIPGRDELLRLMDSLIADPQDTETLVIDGAGALERSINEGVCARLCNGDWGEKGFIGYQRGYRIAVNEWIGLVQRLDALQAAQPISVVILSHSVRIKVTNAIGDDFDQLHPDIHPYSWPFLSRTCDVVLFGAFRTDVDVRPGKEKGKVIGTQRVLYTGGNEAFVAKNKDGMPAEIEVPDDHAQVWNAVTQHITGGVNG